MLPSDDGTTSLSKTSMEKVAIAEPLVDSRRDSTCGPVIGTAAAVSDEDADDPSVILHLFLLSICTYQQ